MRRERKENETAMQHYVNWYECASRAPFWPAMARLCQRANAVVSCSLPAEVDARRVYARAVSSVAIARTRPSKDNFEAKGDPICKQSFLSSSAALLLLAANTEAVVRYACCCEALDCCEPLHQR